MLVQAAPLVLTSNVVVLATCGRGCTRLGGELLPRPVRARILRALSAEWAYRRNCILYQAVSSLILEAIAQRIKDAGTYAMRSGCSLFAWSVEYGSPSPRK